MRKVGATGLWLRLTSQRGVVHLEEGERFEEDVNNLSLNYTVPHTTHLEAPRFDNTDVSGNSVSEFNLNHIAQDQVFGAQRQFLALTDDGGELRNHVLERLHDLGALRLLVVREDTSHDDDSGKYNTQVKIVVGRLVAGTRLDRVGDEAQDGTDP